MPHCETHQLANADLSQSSVVELRQYTLEPGRRDVLIDLFEREFIEPQEALGIQIGGIFRQPARPDRFVWLRGFSDMEARRTALEGFYFGPVWQRHRDEANATMIHSDDVLLLCPTDPVHPVPLRNPGYGAQEWVTIHVYEHHGGAPLDWWLATEVHPLLEETLGVAVGTWRTLVAENSFPQLPVREDLRVFVWTATFPDRATADRAHARLISEPRWQRDVAHRLLASLRCTQRLELEPSVRSQHPASRRA